MFNEVLVELILNILKRLAFNLNVAYFDEDCKLRPDSYINKF